MGVFLNIKQQDSLYLLTGAWCSGVLDTNQYLQVDLGKEKIITRIAIQGRPEEKNYVSSFALNYSNDANNWIKLSKVRFLLVIIILRVCLTSIFFFVASMRMLHVSAKVSLDFHMKDISIS